MAVGDQDGEDGASGSAWTVGGSWGWVLDTTHVDELRQGVRSLETALSGSTLLPNERPSAALTLAYHLHALGDHDAALAAYDRFDWAAPSVGMVDGDAAVVERIRARTFQGIELELCSNPNPTRALQCYVEAVGLLDKLSTSPLQSPSYLMPPNMKQPPVPSFDSQREVLRHVSTALTRAAVISARGSDTHYTLRILRTYHALAVNWPGSFRAIQRQRMLALYMAALQSSYPAPGTTALEPYLLTGHNSGRTGRATWRNEVSDALRGGQRLLGDTTKFPRAGQVNMPVTEFAAQAAAFPDHAPQLASDAIATLWWATNLTFQSQSILRHLVPLLCTSGDPTEARRTFELYVELVLQSRMTDDPDNPLKLERRPTETEEPVEQLVADANGTAAPPAVTNGDDDAEEGETDEHFVTVLLAGTKLLASHFNDPVDAWRYATLAGDVAKRHRLSPQMASKVEACKGTVRLAMSTTVASPTQRPEYQAQAIAHHKAATILDPDSAENNYHLAYASATARQIEPATEAVRSALEEDPHNVHAWHLLALLLTAQGDWNDAAKAGETGVALWESDDETIAADEADLLPEGSLPEQPPHIHTLLLPSGELSPPVTAEAVPPSKFSRLEIVIQLRMTLNVITEKLHGPEVALERHQQLFLFFSQRTDRGDRPRSTASTGIRSGAGSMMSVPAGPIHDLGGSYVITPASGDSAQTVRAPPPPSIIASSAGTGSFSPPVIHTPSSAGDSSPNPSDAEGPSERRVKISVGGKKLFPKHLHVPSVARGPRPGLRASSAPSALRSGGSGRGEPTIGLDRIRTASTSTVALSIAPTAVHSHYHGARAMLPPPPPPTKRNASRTAAELRILSDLWLMSAASFRRAGKHGQALVSIEEAEAQDPENPAVWVQLGLLHQAECGAAHQTGGNSVDGDSQQKAFTKALLLRPDYPPAVVSLGRLFLTQGETDLAHSLLWQLTEDQGWDVPEAWFALATACDKQGRSARAKECLYTALRLQKSRTCRTLGDALGRS